MTVRITPITFPGPPNMHFFYFSGINRRNLRLKFAFLLFQPYRSQKFTVQIHLSLISTVSIAEIYGLNSPFSHFNRINRRNLRLKFAFLLFQPYRSQKFTVQIHLSLILTVSIAKIYGLNSSFSYFNRINRKNLRFKFTFLLFQPYESQKCTP